MKKLLIIICFLFTLVPYVNGQDLLSYQAPVDNRKYVDTLISEIIDKELIESVSSLYDDWDNSRTHKKTELPYIYVIDLKDFCMPTTNRVITSPMGPRWGTNHNGLDIKVYIGDTIRAAFSGKVRIKKYEHDGYGKYLVIRHENGLETIYGHMSDWLVEENQKVKVGQPIGLGGNTGRSTGSHLHFEIRLCGTPINPALMFDFPSQDVTGDYYVFHNVNSSNTQNNMCNIKYHKVSVGETLLSIAKRRHTTIEEVCKLNNLSSDIKVRPGQILRYIPNK